MVCSRNYCGKEVTLEEMNKEYEKLARMNTDWFDILFRNSFNHSHSLGSVAVRRKFKIVHPWDIHKKKGEARETI